MDILDQSMIRSFSSQIWVAFKESSWISAGIWIILLISLGRFDISPFYVFSINYQIVGRPVYVSTVRADEWLI